MMIEEVFHVLELHGSESKACFLCKTPAEGTLSDSIPVHSYLHWFSRGLGNGEGLRVEQRRHEGNLIYEVH